MSIESVMPSNHFILCHPLLLPPWLTVNYDLSFATRARKRKSLVFPQNTHFGPLGLQGYIRECFVLFFPWPHKAWAASPISVTLCQESDEEIPGRQMEITWKSCGENGDFTRTVPKETGPETHSRCSRFNMYFHQKIALLLDPFMLSYYRRITMPSRKVSK